MPTTHINIRIKKTVVMTNIFLDFKKKWINWDYKRCIKTACVIIQVMIKAENAPVRLLLEIGYCIYFNLFLNGFHLADEKGWPEVNKVN